jgi:hypothetical protein
MPFRFLKSATTSENNFAPKWRGQHSVLQSTTTAMVAAAPTSLQTQLESEVEK